MTRARTVAEVIAGEAVSGTPEQRMADMRAIASVIANRAQMLGITPEQVVANSNEFNAYNRSLPPGVGQGIIDMAQQAIDEVAATGPVNNATFYATPAAAGNLPNGLSYEDATTGHQYFSDPQDRAIGSALGYIQPNQYSYAQNLTDVPTPTSSAGLLNDWSEMASAGPMTAPMDSVTAAGLLGSPAALDASAKASLSLPTVNNYADMAAAGPMGGQYASVEDRMGLLSQPSISQADIDRAFFNATGAEIDPAFTAGLMGPQNPVVPTAVQTTSFTPNTGLLAASPTPVDVTATGLLGMTPGLTAYAAAPAVTPAEQAIDQQMASLSVPASATLGLNAPMEAQATVPSISQGLTPAQIAGYQQMAQTASSVGVPSLAGTNLIDLSGDLVPNNYTPAPSLETVEVADQPAITDTQVDIPGPATTPALEQQQITAPTQTVAKPSLLDRMAKAVNPGTVTGGLLGSMALGPVGGLLGSIAGNSVYQGGLLNSAPMTINNIGSGLQNTAAIWGGGTPVGTQATASDGQRITSLPGGLVGVTNQYGVTTGFDSTGKGYAVWGGLGDEAEAESSNSGGGFFGGLFG